MSYDERIDELLEEILDTDRTPEDVCARTPELLAEVQRRLKKLRAIEAEVDSLFPPSAARTLIYDARSNSDSSLPSIPDHDVEMILGRGGMGIVFKAKHTKLQRHVAVKMLLSGSYASKQDQLRFMREAESVAAFRHPNVVQIYEFGEVDGRPYYTMEYVSGGSLAEKLAGTIQPVRESAEMLSALAQGVQAAHQTGIVHRDLKPANILIGNDGSPKISDFGLARRLNQESGLTHTGARIGTPSYMAPEQMMGKATSFEPAVDVFALGAILYEMLSGRPPFRGDTLSDTERRLTTEDPVSLSRFNSRVPNDLETICLKCLEKDPRARYQSAGELSDDLERFLRHEPIRARPVGPLERLARWVWRKPLAATFAVTAVILFGLLIAEAIERRTIAAERNGEKARLTARFESGVQLVRDGRFSEAHAILGKLGDGSFEDLRHRIDRSLEDLSLVEELDSIAVIRALVVRGSDGMEFRNADEGAVYEAIFARVGMGKVLDDPKIIAKRISDSDITGPLVAAIDDWTIYEKNDQRRKWLLDVARLADPDPSGWRDRVRDPEKWLDREALSQLSATAQVSTQPVQLLLSLSERLSAAGLDSLAFRKQIQLSHPDSFLANMMLANSLSESNPVESLRYYQAALSIRPEAASAHNNLAVALAGLGRSEEAIAHYQQAMRLAPQLRRVHYNLGLALASDGRMDEAIEQFKQTIELDPNLSLAHAALGEALLKQERYGEAESAFVKCLNLLAKSDPKRPSISQLLDRAQRLKSRSANP